MNTKESSFIIIIIEMHSYLGVFPNFFIKEEVIWTKLLNVNATFALPTLPNHTKLIALPPHHHHRHLSPSPTINKNKIKKYNCFFFFNIT